MYKIIQQRLNNIEQMARQILRDVEGIFGYCDGMEMVANDYPTTFPQQLVGYGNQSTTKPLTEEIKEMIVELKIKGSVRERANGLIELRTQAFGSIYGRTKNEIETKLTKALKEEKKRKKEQQKLATPTNFDKFALYWFENFHKRKVKDNTYKHDAWLYKKHIQNRLAGYQIGKIPPTLMQSIFDEYEDRGKTREDMHSLLNQIFSSAMQHGILKVNPLAMCFVEAHEREHGKALTKDEERQLLEAYKETHYQACFAMVLYTGLRPNEYSTVEIEDNFIKAVNSKRKGKNKKVAYKRIPISPMLRPYIADFAKMLSPQIMDNKLKAVLQNHKLYDMRTTFQTRCTECGVSDVAIGMFMGNSIGGALKEAYTDLSDEYLLHEGEKLNY